VCVCVCATIKRILLSQIQVIICFLTTLAASHGTPTRSHSSIICGDQLPGSDVVTQFYDRLAISRYTDVIRCHLSGDSRLQLYREQPTRTQEQWTHQLGVGYIWTRNSNTNREHRKRNTYYRNGDLSTTIKPTGNKTYQ